MENYGTLSLSLSLSLLKLTLRSTILRENARKEFEQSQYETDPQTITRLILVGRDALTKTMEKVAEKAANPPPSQPNSGPNSQPTWRS
jgi:hypothetical protein